MSLELRRCLKDPIPEIEEAAKKLSEAADAHLQGDSETVRQLLVETNMPAIRAWTESIWSKTPALSPGFKPFKLVPKDSPGQRLADRGLQSQLHERDGHRCRFCGIPVIHADIRKLFHRAYPEIQVWGRTNLSQHAAFQAMWAQYDHLVPFRRGGTTKLPEARVLAIAGFYSALQSFQAVILLAERGALAEARTMSRLCCEAVIVAGGLLKDEGTVKKLHEDHAKHCLSLAQAMISMNETANSGLDLTRFRLEVARVMAEYPEKPKPLKLSSLSAQVGLGKLYELSYRLPSGDSAHVSLGALHRHFKKNDQGAFTNMIFHPDKSDLRSTLLSANAALVHLLGLAQEFMDLNHYEAEIRDLLLQWAIAKEELGLNVITSR